VAHGADASIYIEKQWPGNLEHDAFNAIMFEVFRASLFAVQPARGESAEPIASRSNGFQGHDFYSAKTS
jgi:hypothetical protein